MRRLRKFIIKTLARAARVDLLTLAYHDMGILNYENPIVSGETYLVMDVLRRRLSDVRSPTIFDVGANVGKITMLFRQAFPGAAIWAFEPNPHSYEQLVDNVSHPQTRCFNLGMGSSRKMGRLYLPVTPGSLSSAATTHRDLLVEFHHASEIEDVVFETVTLDCFCDDQQIDRIDFLKIDTEGNELDVLLGGGKMLFEGRIQILQFEFGECHVYSRTFMRDFYQLLPEYQFFRLGPRRLIPLGEYKVADEIFRFQNVVAFHNGHN